MPRIPIFPLDVVVFPGEDLPLQIMEERYLLMIEECIHHDSPFGVALARQDEPEEVVEHEPEDVGTAVEIVAHEKLKDGRYVVAATGLRRFRVRRVVSDRMYQEADVEWLDEDVGGEHDAESAEDGVRRELARLGVGIVAEDAEDPVETSYAVAAALDAPHAVKQMLLSADTAAERLLLEEAILRMVPATNLN